MVRSRRRVGDRRGAHSRLAGICAAGYAPAHRRRDAGPGETAGCRRTGEGAFKDEDEYRGDLRRVGGDDAERAEDIEHRHEGDQLFRDRGDPRNAAEDDDADEQHEGDSRQPGRHAEHLHRLRRGDGLGGDGEENDDHCAEGVGEGHRTAEPLIFQPLAEIIHGAANVISLGIFFTVIEAEDDLGKLCRRTDERRRPHPKDCAGAAEGDRHGDADDIGGSDCGGKRRRGGGEGGYGALAVDLFEHGAKGLPHDIGEIDELEKAQTHGEKDASSDDKDQHGIAPKPI